MVCAGVGQPRDASGVEHNNSVGLTVMELSRLYSDRSWCIRLVSSSRAYQDWYGSLVPGSGVFEIFLYRVGLNIQEFWVVSVLFSDLREMVMISIRSSTLCTFL